MLEVYVTQAPEAKQNKEESLRTSLLEDQGRECWNKASGE